MMKTGSSSILLLSGLVLGAGAGETPTESPSARVLFELDFDEGFTARAYGQGAVANKNTPALVEGIHGRAARFSKGTVLQYLEQNNLDKEKGTLSMWVKAGDIQDPYFEPYPERILFTESGSPKPGNNAFKLWKSIWGGLRFDLRDKGNAFWGAYDIYNWAPDEWHHVALVWNHQKGVSIYIDGWLAQSADIKKQKRGLIPLDWEAISAEHFFIGADGSDGRLGWRGTVDEVRIYDRDLAPTEVQRDYERLSNGKLRVSTTDRYWFAGQRQTCRIALENHSGKTVKIAPTCTVSEATGKRIATQTFPPMKIKASARAGLELELSLPVVGDYVLEVNYGGNVHHFPLKALPPVDLKKSGGELALELIETIDAVKPSSGGFAEEGDSRVIDGLLGKYRETGANFHDRFALGFDVPETGVPYLAVVSWPDNAKRSMEILFHSQNGKQSYQAPGGVFGGGPFLLSGEMKEYKVVFWPMTQQSAFIFMNLEDGTRAAVQEIKIYRIEGSLPRLPVAPFAGSVPPRRIGIFYEDPVLPMCFGGGSLFPGFEASTDRLLDYMQWFGQDLLLYPISWYHGPLYDSDTEPSVANRAVRMHPYNFPDYLLKRMQTRDMKLIGQLNMQRLESVDNLLLIDEKRVIAGEETVANMRNDNHLQLTTLWSTPETRYNNLDPRVQQAVKDIVEEIADRYGDRPAFGGLMLFAKASGMFALGSINGGYNDINLSRFQKNTGVEIPAYTLDNPMRFSESFQWLQNHPEAMERWIDWRCGMIRDFYRELAAILTRKRPDLKLYVFCLDADRETGIDLSLFIDEPAIEITAANRVNSMQHRMRHGSPIGVESARTEGLIPEGAQAYEQLPQVSSVLFDEYFEDALGRSAPMKNLARVLPGTTEVGWRCSAINPNTFYVLENYVAVLNNLDAISLSKGGFAIGTLGGEEWIGKFAQAYRTLPSVRFDDVAGIDDPVRVRQKVVDGKNYFYVLNRLPVAVEFSLTLASEGAATNRVTEKAADLTALKLEPYALKTFSASPNAQVLSGTAIVPESWVRRLAPLLKRAEVELRQLEKNGIPVSEFKQQIQLARNSMQKKRYARLYLSLYESWVNDLGRLLDDSALQTFLKEDSINLADQNRRRHGLVKSCRGTIEIDGVLKERDWANAQVVDDFADFFNYKGEFLVKAKADNTEVRLLYDDQNIYLGIRCDDCDTDSIIVKKGLKDGPIWANDDSVEFFFKGTDTAKGRFAQLLVNAGSSQTDIFGGGAGRSWNVDWQAQSRIVPGQGWVCEIALPLKEIGKTETNKLLFNIGRNRGVKPQSFLSLRPGRGGAFHEADWMELDFE